jgi:hypothetical protein
MSRLRWVVTIVAWNPDFIGVPESRKIDRQSFLESGR